MLQSAFKRDISLRNRVLLVGRVKKNICQLLGMWRVVRTAPLIPIALGNCGGLVSASARPAYREGCGGGGDDPCQSKKKHLFSTLDRPFASYKREREGAWAHSDIFARFYEGNYLFKSYIVGTRQRFTPPSQQYGNPGLHRDYMYFFLGYNYKYVPNTSFMFTYSCRWSRVIGLKKILVMKDGYSKWDWVD